MLLGSKSLVRCVHRIIVFFGHSRSLSRLRICQSPLSSSADVGIFVVLPDWLHLRSLQATRDVGVGSPARSINPFAQRALTGADSLRPASSGLVH